MKELVSLIKNSSSASSSLEKLLERAAAISEEYLNLGKAEIIIFENNELRDLHGNKVSLFLDGKAEDVFKGNKPIVKNRKKGFSEIYAPIFDNNKLIGLIKFERGKAFTERDIEDAEVFSATLGIIIAHSHLVETVEEKLRKLELLYRISRELRKTIDLDVLLKTIVEIVKGVFEIESVAVLLKTDENTLRIFASSGGFDEKVVHTREIDIESAEGITGLAAKKRKTVISNNVKKDSRYINGNKTTRSEMAIPLIHKGNLLGVLDLESDKENRFTDEDRKILEVVADEISVAIENALLYEKVKELAEKDELTGLYNYRAFRKELDREVSRSLRYGKKFSLVMFDVDYFKNYNDNNGHDMGNVVLHTVGTILRKATRKTDFPARFGGEEFIVILPETGKGGAFVFAERIRATIENKHFPGEEKQPNGKLTVSGGVAEFPSDGGTAEKIIKAVDIAAYKAKSNGRNRIEIFRREWEG